MKPYLRILVALLSTASIGLAQAPRAAIVTGEVHNLSLIHISEPTRRTPISYAVFCLKKKKGKEGW